MNDAQQQDSQEAAGDCRIPSPFQKKTCWYALTGVAILVMLCIAAFVMSFSCRAAQSSHPSVSAIRSTSHPATAVGVLSAVWATMSATLVSLSCPMPVPTGSGNCATWAQRR